VVQVPPIAGSDGPADPGRGEAGRPDPPGVADPAEGPGPNEEFGLDDGVSDPPQAARPTTNAIARPATLRLIDGLYRPA
jgi:hypothetical protein